MRIKGGGHKLDIIFIVAGILMLDAVICLLLELLLDGYGTYYDQGSGSDPNENIAFKERLVLSAMYVWYAVNLIAMSVLVYGRITKGKKRRFKIKRVSNN